MHCKSLQINDLRGLSYAQSSEKQFVSTVFVQTSIAIPAASEKQFVVHYVNSHKSAPNSAESLYMAICVHNTHYVKCSQSER